MVLKRHPHNPSIRYFEANGLRYYVKRTNVQSYVVATCYPFGLDDMVSIRGDYHFATLRELRAAVDAHGIGK